MISTLTGSPHPNPITRSYVNFSRILRHAISKGNTHEGKNGHYTEYRHQIKTIRLKYIFLAGKIIKTARSVVMKLSEKYPYQEIYEKSLSE